MKRIFYNEPALVSIELLQSLKLMNGREIEKQLLMNLLFQLQLVK